MFSLLVYQVGGSTHTGGMCTLVSVLDEWVQLTFGQWQEIVRVWISTCGECVGGECACAFVHRWVGACEHWEV